MMVLPVAAVTAPLPWLFPGQRPRGRASQARCSCRTCSIGHARLRRADAGALHALLMRRRRARLHRPLRRREAARALDRRAAAADGARARAVPAHRIGFVLLTLTALAACLFSEDIFGRPLRLDHKTVFALIRLVGCSVRCCSVAGAGDGAGASRCA